MRVVVFAFAFVLSFIVCMPQDRRALCLFFVAFSFLAFICVLRSLRSSFADRIEHSLVLMCATRFLPFLSFAHSLYIYIYLHTHVDTHTCSLRAYHIVYPASGLCGGTLYGRNAVFNTFRHTRLHTYSGLIIVCI